VGPVTVSPFFLAPRIASGPDALRTLGGLGGVRPAILLDPALARHGWADRLALALGRESGRLDVAVWPGAEPTFEAVDALAGGWRSARPDWIVAAGGGRVLAAAKAAWVRYARPEVDLKALTPIDALGLRSTAQFATLPSTSGSGGEVGGSTIVWDDGARPYEVASRELVPDWTLLDPSATAGAPATVTVDAGAQVLVHAVEALASPWSSPFTDSLAQAGFTGAASALPRVVRHLEDVDLRGELMHAAAFAGLAASNAQLGPAHALAVALTPETSVPYGRLLGILGPYVAEFNHPSVREKLGRSAPVLGPAVEKDRSALAERLRAILGPLGLPRTLADAGVPPAVRAERATEVIARARTLAASVASPRVPSEAEYVRLLAAAYDGAAVTF
jgi:alcohol dehydrogenase class IV